jgi:hypothetical protein
MGVFYWHCLTVYKFSLVKTYADDSHIVRDLLKCADCGHLYFHEFYEEIDWKEGNDAQYTSFIPVDDIRSADNLSKLSPLIHPLPNKSMLLG